MDEDGKVTPVYAESKVTVFPFPMEVDYENNRVYPAGRASVTVDVDQPDEDFSPGVLN